MSVKVMIPRALRQFADGEDVIELAGNNVGEVLDQLSERCPKLKPHLFADDGQLRNFVNVFVNEENIRDRDNQQTSVREGDELSIVPAIAGGADP